MSFDFLDEWLNGQSTEIPDTLSLTELAGLLTALNIKLRFTQSNQAKFLEHFLSIKGESLTSKETEEVLTIMFRLYDQADTIGSGLMADVAQILLERINEGLSLHDAMSDMFLSNFGMIMRASSSKALTKDENAQVLLNKAINIATKDAIEISKSQRNTTIKVMIGMMIMFLSLFAASAGSTYYQNLKQETPNVDEFIDIPTLLYRLGDWFVDYSLLMLIAVAILIVAQRYFMKNWLGENREFLDNYWPPFIIYRLIAGLTIFSGLTLLISYIRYETITAIEALHQSASEYERYHLEMMIDKLSEGEAGTRQLDTGLLTKDLKLTLQMAGEGESASIRTALEIINQEGKKSLISKLNHVSTLLMLFMIFAAILVLIQVGAASAFLFQASLGI
ncbi:hypothetical protein M6C35_001879 [Vibrio metschnikovii]|nr:hypothetical protein [Vibrio metschnikovii]